MALNPLNPRLRVINKSNGVAKVDLRIAAGDELEVSAEVAAQLGSEFTDAGSVPQQEAEVLAELATEPAAEKPEKAPAKKAPAAKKARG